jgi:hypothetical protein
MNFVPDLLTKFDAFQPDVQVYHDKHQSEVWKPLCLHNMLLHISRLKLAQMSSSNRAEFYHPPKNETHILSNLCLQWPILVRASSEERW